MDRAELLQRIHEARRRLEHALARVEESRMADPELPGGWSVKDVMAHIGFWENRAAHLYDLLSRGEVPTDGVEGEGVDALNARVFKENRHRSLEEIRRSEGEAFQRLLLVAQTASEEDLFSPDRFAWTEGEPYVNWIAANSYDHYDEHIAALYTWLDGVSTNT